ncbi:MAG: hypothetical protein JRF64_03460 [Deltaproteobacteria bacterium]|nr:hypothetical protein [Deltaproteobacteria bacterium]
MTYRTSLKISGSRGSAMSVSPVADMVDGPGILMTSDAKSFNVAIGARFLLCQCLNTVAPDLPETGVAFRAVQLMAFSASMIFMTRITVVAMTGFDYIPCLAIRQHHRLDPYTVPYSPLSRRLMI